MHRFTVSLALVIALLVGVIATLGRSATAHDETMAEHAVVGAWEFENDAGGDTATSYAVFHPDGTYTEATWDGVTLIGVWRPTGDHSADLTFFAADLDLDPNVTVLGEGRQSIEVDEMGNALTADGFFQARDPDGVVLFGAAVLSQGTRLEVAPVEAMRSPRAGTPTS